jgi:hypothetical protein
MAAKDARLKAKIEEEIKRCDGFDDYARLNHSKFRGVGALILDGRKDALKWVIEQIDTKTDDGLTSIKDDYESSSDIAERNELGRMGYWCGRSDGIHATMKALGLADALNATADADTGAPP